MMLAVMRRSTTKVGSGTTRTTTTATTDSGTAMVATRLHRWSWPTPVPRATGSATHVPRLVSKDGLHVRHSSPAAASQSVPGHISAVLAKSCSPYYGPARSRVQGSVPGGRVQPVAPNAVGAIRCTSPNSLAVGESE